jgi:DNA-binding NarL/FixJ family response regulator
MNTFILADNQELTSYAVQSLIAENEDNTTLRVSNRIGLIGTLKEHPDSVVILDFELMDFVNAEQLIILSERFSSSRWILLSDNLTPDIVSRVMYNSQSFSVVFKDDPVSEIRSALRAAMRGERHVSNRTLELTLMAGNIAKERENLTATEQEITILIAQGKSSKEIAMERVLSVHTVNTHRKNIFRKLGVNTAHDVTRYALRAGLLDSSEFYI